MLHVPQVPVMSLEGSLLWDPTGSNGFVTARRARLPGWGPFMEAPHEGGDSEQGESWVLRCALC